MTYIPGTWHDHRRLWAGSERTWRLSLEERMADWAEGCGWCGEPYELHDRLVPIATADAVTRMPLPPIDPAAADVVLGRIFGSQLGHLNAEHERALAEAVSVVASLDLP